MYQNASILAFTLFLVPVPYVFSGKQESVVQVVGLLTLTRESHIKFQTSDWLAKAVTVEGTGQESTNVSTPSQVLAQVPQRRRRWNS